MSTVVMVLASIAAVAQNNNVIDEIIWLVGDEAIFKSEVEEQRLQAQIQGVHWDGDPYCLIPEELAIQKLFLNQAGVTAPGFNPAEQHLTIDMTKVKDANGKYWYLGKDEPVNASASDGQTGTARGDTNRYSITLQDTSLEMPYEVSDSIIEGLL